MTLFVYYSENDEIRALCEQSRMDGTVTRELLEGYDRSPAYVATIGAYSAMCGKSSAIEKLDIDISEFDTVVVASPVWAGCPVPAVNAFLRSTDLRGKSVYGLLFGKGVGSVLASDTLRKRITLAGGSCEGVVSIPKEEFRRKGIAAIPALA